MWVKADIRNPLRCSVKITLSSVQNSKYLIE